MKLLKLWEVGKLFSMITPFEAMQNAVDIVHSSEHNKNKVAACIVSPLGENISQTNYRPQQLKDNFSPDERIGNSSQFIHAEVACIINAPFATNGASIYITDPMCPNCAKAICEAGIKHVYIDHKGMEKDFFIRRKDAFEQISVPLMQEYGVTLSTIYRKEQKIVPFIQKERQKLNPHTPIQIFKNYKIIEQFLEQENFYKNYRSYTITKTDNGILFVPEVEHHITHNNDKYRDDISPLNRLLYHVKQHQLSIINNHIYCNLYPSSRDLVNATGYGIKKITIGQNIPDHDENGESAVNTLKQFDILDIHTVS